LSLILHFALSQRRCHYFAL